MLEIAFLIVLLVGGAVIAGVLAVAGFLVKLILKLLLVPLVLAGWLLKALLGLVAFVLLLAVAGPVVLVIGALVLLPLLVLAGMVWGAVSLLSAA